MTQLDELMALLAAKPDFKFLKVPRSLLEGIVKEMGDLSNAVEEAEIKAKDRPQGIYRQP